MDVLLTGGFRGGRVIEEDSNGEHHLFGGVLGADYDGVSGRGGRRGVGGDRSVVNGMPDSP